MGREDGSGGWVGRMGRGDESGGWVERMGQEDEVMLFTFCHVKCGYLHVLCGGDSDSL